jgi:hypothetical protein
MKLIATLIGSGAYSVYSTDDRPIAEVIEASITVGALLLLPPSVRLVEVGSEPAPEFLPPDLSPSLVDE